MILDYELGVDLAVSSQINLCCKAIDNPPPGSISSPDRYTSTCAPDETASSELRDQAVPRPVVVIDVLDWQKFDPR